MKKRTMFMVVCAAAMMLPATAFAQDKFTVSGNIDVVNNYVWRGMDQNSGFSVQPTIGLSYKGFIDTRYRIHAMERLLP